MLCNLSGHLLLSQNQLLRRFYQVFAARRATEATATPSSYDTFQLAILSALLFLLLLRFLRKWFLSPSAGPGSLEGSHRAGDTISQGQTGAVGRGGGGLWFPFGESMNLQELLQQVPEVGKGWESRREGLFFSQFSVLLKYRQLQTYAQR